MSLGSTGGLAMALISQEMENSRTFRLKIAVAFLACFAIGVLTAVAKWEFHLI